MNKNVLIRLNGISKSFDGETVLDHINLEIQNREFITLLGPSGCGKTTTLRIIGGFETPDEGDVFFDGKRINDIPPYKRQVNTVFQRYALFPHLNVFDNIAFGLRIQKCPDEQIKVKVKEMLAIQFSRCKRNQKKSPLLSLQKKSPCWQPKIYYFFIFLYFYKQKEKNSSLFLSKNDEYRLCILNYLYILIQFYMFYLLF